VFPEKGPFFEKVVPCHNLNVSASFAVPRLPTSLTPRVREAVLDECNLSVAAKI